jgi:hypothetical protein
MKHALTAAQNNALCNPLFLGVCSGGCTKDTVSERYMVSESSSPSALLLALVSGHRVPL